MGCTLYFPSTSSKASAALRTHSRPGHRGIPVSTPFNSLQMVAPHLFSKFRIIALAVLGVPFPFVNAPATITAPIRAPQLLSIQPMPAAYPVDSSISVSSAAVAVLFKVREQRVDLRRRYANQVHRRRQLFQRGFRHGDCIFFAPILCRLFKLFVRHG